VVSEILGVKVGRNTGFFAHLAACCMSSFNCFVTTETAMHRTSNAETLVAISLGWLQNWKCSEGSNLVQINEIGKLACEPSLTMRCVGAVTPIVIEHRLFVANLVLLQPCDFRSDPVVSPSVVTRQSCNTLRFSRMDQFFRVFELIFGQK
jgi:hypothetical protein